MSQSTIVGLGLILAFIVYITVKGELRTYLGLLGIGTGLGSSAAGAGGSGAGAAGTAGTVLGQAQQAVGLLGQADKLLGGSLGSGSGWVDYTSDIGADFGGAVTG